MAMLNIPSYRDDPNYRYKMPRLLSKVEGRGNGIKTNVMNMAEIARALKRSPEYTTKFCGHELGAPVKFESAEGKAIINGAFDSKDLQQLIDKFVDKYVLCPGCSLPEIDLLLKKGRVGCHCNACGHSCDLDNSHKLATYIVKNPPNCSDSTMGKKGKTGTSKAQRREKKIKAAGGADPPSGTESADKKDSADAKKAKKEKKKGSKKTKKDEDGKAGSEEAADADAASELKPKKTKTKKVKEEAEPILEKEYLGYDSPEILDVMERLRAFLSSDEDRARPVSSDDFFREARVLQVSQDFDSVVRLYVGLDAIFGEEITPSKVEQKIHFLRVLIDGSMNTTKVCMAFEDYLERRASGQFSEYPFILQKLYVADLVDEKGLLTRYRQSSESKSSDAFKKAKAAAEPFIDWLEGDESGSSGEESDEDVAPLPNGPSIKSLGALSTSVSSTVAAAAPCGSKAAESPNSKEDEVQNESSSSEIDDDDDLDIDEI